MHKHIYATVITEGKSQLFEDKICNLFNVEIGNSINRFDQLDKKIISVKKAGLQSLYSEGETVCSK